MENPVRLGPTRKRCVPPGRQSRGDLAKLCTAGVYVARRYGKSWCSVTRSVPIFQFGHEMGDEVGSSFNSFVDGCCPVRTKSQCPSTGDGLRRDLLQSTNGSNGLEGYMSRFKVSLLLVGRSRKWWWHCHQLLRRTSGLPVEHPSR